MNHTLAEAYNIDRIVQELQTKLYDELIVRWNTSKLDAYGMVYRNEKGGKVFAEVFDAVKKNYKRVFYNGQSCFFFVDQTKHTTDEEHEFLTDVKICFMVNLDDITTATERADSDVKNDVIEFIRKWGYEFKITDYIKTIDEVFRGFDTEASKKAQNDMHPLHVFAIEGLLNYSIRDKF